MIVEIGVLRSWDSEDSRAVRSPSFSATSFASEISSASWARSSAIGAQLKRGVDPVLFGRADVTVLVEPHRQGADLASRGRQRRPSAAALVPLWPEPLRRGCGAVHGAVGGRQKRAALAFGPDCGLDPDLGLQPPHEHLSDGDRRSGGREVAARLQERGQPAQAIRRGLRAVAQAPGHRPRQHGRRDEEAPLQQIHRRHVEAEAPRVDKKAVGQGRREGGRRARGAGRTGRQPA